MFTDWNPLNAMMRTVDAVNYCQSESGVSHDIIIGPGSSGEAVNSALVASQFDVPIISASATSPDLSNKIKYPTFNRLFPPDDNSVIAMASFISSYGWKKVAILVSNNAYNQGLATAFTELVSAPDSNITVVATASYETTATNVFPALSTIKSSGARIILSFISNAEMVFSNATSVGMVGEQYVWIGGDSLASFDASTISRPEDFLGLVAFTAHIDYTVPEYLALETAWAASPLTDFAFGGKFTLGTYNIILYDSVIHGMRALHSLVELEFSCENPVTNVTTACQDLHSNGAGKTLTDFIRSTTWDGASGNVLLNEKGDRLGSYVIRNIRADTDGVIAAQDVGVYDPSTAQVTMDTAIVWGGGRTTIPLDEPVIREVQNKVQAGLYYAFVALMAISIILCLFFAMSTMAHKNEKIIKMSSPNMNVLSAFGAIVTLLSVPFVGSNANDASRCHASVWLLTIGSTVAFGPLFSKIFRVVKIFSSKSLQVKIIKDSELLHHTMGLLLVDFIILGLWSVMDPMTIKKVFFPITATSNPDVEILPFDYQCTSDNMNDFLAALLAYKGAFLLAGAALSWKVRNVNIAALNDSKWIGFAIYNVFFFAIVVYPVSNLIKDEPDAHFALIAAGIVFALSLSMCLVFVPKEIALRNGDTEGMFETNGNTYMGGTKINDTSINPSSQKYAYHGDRVASETTSSGNRGNEIEELKALLKKNNIQIPNSRSSQ